MILVGICLGCVQGVCVGEGVHTALLQVGLGQECRVWYVCAKCARVGGCYTALLQVGPWHGVSFLSACNGVFELPQYMPRNCSNRNSYCACSTLQQLQLPSYMPRTCNNRKSCSACLETCCNPPLLQYMTTLVDEGFRQLGEGSAGDDGQCWVWLCCALYAANVVTRRWVSGASPRMRVTLGVLVRLCCPPATCPSVCVVAPTWRTVPSNSTYMPMPAWVCTHQLGGRCVVTGC